MKERYMVQNCNLNGCSIADDPFDCSRRCVNDHVPMHPGTSR